MKKLIILLALSFSTGIVEAEIYKYTDKNGVIRYTDKPPTEKDSEITILKLKSNQLEQDLNNLDEKQKQTEQNIEQLNNESENTSQKIRDLEERHKQLEELNEKQNTLINDQNKKLQTLESQKAKNETTTKKKQLTGCKLANELKFVKKSEKLSESLINSADLNSDGSFYGSTTDGRVYGSTVRTYTFRPVCQNQTRYSITIDALGNVLEIDRKIER